MGSIAKSVGILAGLTGLPATFDDSEASLTACETTSQESVIHFDRSKILSFERTAAADEKQTYPTNKTNFPMNSITTFVGRTMPSPDSVILFNGFSRVSSSIAVSFRGVVIHLIAKARRSSAFAFLLSVIEERFKNRPAIPSASSVFPPTAAASQVLIGLTLRHAPIRRRRLSA